MDFNGGKSITRRAVWRGGPRNRDFFEPWNGNERSECIWAPKSRGIDYLNRFLGSLNKFGPWLIDSVLPFAFYNCVHTIHDTSSSISQCSLGTHSPLTPLHIPPPPHNCRSRSAGTLRFLPILFTLGRKPECCIKSMLCPISLLHIHVNPVLREPVILTKISYFRCEAYNFGRAMKIYKKSIKHRFSKYWAVSCIFDLLSLKKVRCPF